MIIYLCDVCKKELDLNIIVIKVPMDGFHDDEVDYHLCPEHYATFVKMTSASSTFDEGKRIIMGMKNERLKKTT